MSDIPKLQTKDEYIEQEKKTNPEAVTFELMFALAGARMSGGYSSKPTYNDQTEVAQKAYTDIKNMDFSDIGDYIDSLERIADHWQEYAEHYFNELKSIGCKFDDYGYVSEVPEVILETEDEVTTAASPDPETNTKPGKNALES